MSTSHDTRAESLHSEVQLVVGAGMKVPFLCPDCGQSGHVDWKNLNRPMRCQKCGCRFLIDRDGQLRSFADIAQLQFSCPRCHQTGFIPATLIDHSTSCPACKLPLVRGPDERLYAAEDLAEVLRITAQSKARRAAIVGKLERLLTVGGVWTVVCGVGLFLAIVLAGAVLLARTMFSSATPDDIAANFTRLCLAGQFETALEKVGDDEAQQAEFRRWSIRYFASIQDDYRPQGDRVQLKSIVVQSDGHQRQITMTMKSPAIGVRSHLQVWRQRQGSWWFDAISTLAQQDRTLLRSGQVNLNDKNTGASAAKMPTKSAR